MEAHAPDAGPARISITEPISTAFAWTGKVLFRPFDAGKWFGLGFCAWLAWIGQHGGGGGGGNWGRDLGQDGFSHAQDWILGHLTLVVALVVALVILIIVLTFVFTWLSSRAKLMFLDGVVHDRGAVVEPWHRFREQGNSLFGFRVVVGLAFFVSIVALTGAAAALLFGLGLDVDDPGPGLVLLVVGWLLVLLPVLVVAGLFGIAVNDLVVPIQWLRGCRALAAWDEARRLIARHALTFVGYAAMKILLALAIGIITCVATCLSCCLAALPYLGTVILLPLYVFGRSYSMHFLAQFGPQYAALAPADTTIPPPGAETPA